MVEITPPTVQPAQIPALPPAVQPNINIEIPKEILDSFKGIADSLKAIKETVNDLPKKEKKEAPPFYQRYFYHGLAVAGVAAFVYYYPEQAQSLLDKAQGVGMRLLNKGINAMPQSVQNFMANSIQSAASLYNQTAAAIPQGVKTFAENGFNQTITVASHLKNGTQAVAQAVLEEVPQGIQDGVVHAFTKGKDVFEAGVKTVGIIGDIIKESPAFFSNMRDGMIAIDQAAETASYVAGLPAATVRGVANTGINAVNFVAGSNITTITPTPTSVRGIQGMGISTLASHIGLNLLVNVVGKAPGMDALPIPDGYGRIFKLGTFAYSSFVVAVQPSIGLPEVLQAGYEKAYDAAAWAYDHPKTTTTIGATAIAATVYVARALANMPWNFLVGRY